MKVKIAIKQEKPQEARVGSVWTQGGTEPHMLVFNQWSPKPWQWLDLSTGRIRAMQFETPETAIKDCEEIKAKQITIS